jgi:hypothetical protein
LGNLNLKKKKKYSSLKTNEGETLNKLYLCISK